MEKYLNGIKILSKIYFGQQLPITSHLTKFKKLITNNDIVLVKVGTGSGKSTVIPPYLVGIGYEKVVVTQPRRLPCRQLVKRVNAVFDNISGYEIADEKQYPDRPLIYKTDGLLKMETLFDFKIFDQIDVLVIDEIHERSANIDILLLLLS
jgi:HrpA-like RNA helicase